MIMTTRKMDIRGFGSSNNGTSDGVDDEKCCHPSNPKKWCSNCTSIHRECWCFIFLLMIAAISVTIIAAFKYDRWPRWQDSTQETCKLLTDEWNLRASACEGEGDVKYQYTAIAFDKCGNQTLNLEANEADFCVSESNKKEVGQKYNCYVLDCSQSEFKFHDPEDFYYKQAMILVIVGAAITFMVICCICGGIIFGWSYSFMDIHCACCDKKF